jgi:NTE family protein
MLMHGKVKGLKSGIVLSGGGIKGVAHLGVLQVLQDNKIAFDGVIGTSAGSIAAGTLALGISPREMLAEIKKAKPKDLYDLPWWLFLLWQLYQYLPRKKAKSMLQISLPDGLMSGKKIEKWLGNIFTDVALDEIDFPLALTTTDINTAQSVVYISRGLKNITLLPILPAIIFADNARLTDAIRASTAIPGIFSPKVINNRVLIDGGVTNNLPADILKHLGCEKILGVDLGQQENLTRPVKNMVDIAIKSVEIMVQSTSSLTAAAYCDLTLFPQTGAISLWHLEAIDAVYEAGAAAAANALPEIRRIFGG